MALLQTRRCHCPEREDKNGKAQSPPRIPLWSRATSLAGEKEIPYSQVNTHLRAVRQLNQEALTIRPWEVEYTTRLSPFITTPRGAKRFANIYRLIKAPLSPTELVAFEGTGTSQEEFQAPMLLLAILTGFPQLSAQLFEALDSQQSVSITAQQFFADIAKYLPGSPLTTQLQDCINRFGPSSIAAMRETFLNWIPRVARFSFYTAKVNETTA
jgi:hypothetical protein